jgi:3-mercaptopyruvate sulfurtransferase SseA
VPHAFVRLIRACAFAAALALPVLASASLVSVDELRRLAPSGDVLLIDTSTARQYAAKHIPGAINVDVLSYGPMTKASPAEMERRFRSWGLSAGRKVVLYDEGGSMWATWLFHELVLHGFPASDLAVLDGGLAHWEATGGAVTKEPAARPAAGTFRVTALVEADRVRLDAFLAASGDPANHAIVEALEPAMHFGGTKFFDRPGHVPNAVMLPHADFYNADKTFKSPAEIRRMAAYFGITPDKRVLAYCGGGIAATVPWFALKVVSGYPRVAVYRESLLEWLQDERGLPTWTYDVPSVKREMGYVAGWGSRMLRMYGVTRMSLVDVRSGEQYRANHIPYAVNVPADVFRRHLDEPAALAALLGPAGVNPAHEAVIVSAGGLNPESALAYVALERAGQRKVAVMMDSPDEWGMRGHPLTKDPTIVGAPKAPTDAAVPAVDYAAAPRPTAILRDPHAGAGAYPKVFVAAGATLPATRPAGTVAHVPWTALVAADGTPKPAHEIWTALAKAGVPRYAEIVVFADDAGDAAVNYVVLKMMGWPDVKLLRG